MLFVYDYGTICDTDGRTHNIIVLITDKCHVLYYLNI